MAKFNQHGSRFDADDIDWDPLPDDRNYVCEQEIAESVDGELAEPTAINHEGEPAYEISDQLNLATRALTMMMAEDRFYENAEAHDNELLRLFESVLEHDPVFAKGLLLTVRKEFHLRSVSHALAATLASSRAPEAAALIAEICERPDDMLEVLAYYTKKYGDKKLPNSLKKGLARAFGKFNEHQLAKYNRRRGPVWLRDILRIAHPAPKDAEQEALWGRVVGNTLKTPETWEVKMSTEGSTKENWADMITSGKMGYMALLRNLRNFLKHDVPMSQVCTVAQVLSDPERVQRSKQLPFRFWSAYRALKAAVGLHTGRHARYADEDYEPEEGQSVNIAKAEILFEALEEAARHAVANIPRLPGTTAIACDVSGSMQVPLSGKSSVQNFDIGLLMGALAGGFSEKAITGIFGDDWKEIEIDPRRPLASTFEMHRREGEVGYSTHAYKVVAELLDNRRRVDRLLFFSDGQMYGEDRSHGFGRGNDRLSHQAEDWEFLRQNSMGWLIQEYRRRINRHLKVYFFNLAGYSNCIIPQDDPQTLFMGGWSEKLFELVPAFESGGDRQVFLNRIRQAYLDWKGDAATLRDVMPPMPPTGPEHLRRLRAQGDPAAPAPLEDKEYKGGPNVVTRRHRKSEDQKRQDERAAKEGLKAIPA